MRMIGLLILACALTHAVAETRPDDLVSSVSSPDGTIRFALAMDPFGSPRYTVSRGDEVPWWMIRASACGLKPRRLLTRTWSWSELRRPAMMRPGSNPGASGAWCGTGTKSCCFSLPTRMAAGSMFACACSMTGWVSATRSRRNRVSMQVNIVDELTEFSLPEGSTAWWIPGRRYNRYEYLYRTTGLDEIETAHTPMTLRTPSGTHLSIHEAALVDYAGFVLDQRRDNVFQTNLTPWSDGIRVKTAAPFHTPWRTIQVSENAVGLLNSSLILNLNEPNTLGDVSWVKPGKYVGIWWAMHIKERTWGSGPIHGATTAETMRYMDFAAKYGFDGVLVEGWNVGWDGDWFHNGDSVQLHRALS